MKREESTSRTILTLVCGAGLAMIAPAALGDSALEGMGVSRLSASSADHVLWMRAGVVSTAAGAGNLGALAGTTPASGRYVIQLDGPMTVERRAALVRGILQRR